MSIYGIDKILLDKLIDDSTVETWYHDDINNFNSLANIEKLCLESLKKHGPNFGYHLIKRHFIIKEHLFGAIMRFFAHDEVERVAD